MADKLEFGDLEKPSDSPIVRPTSPGLDQLLGKKLPVLDDGFVRVVDYLGEDDAIVQAARVSYGKGTRKIQEDDALIRYLMRHRHSTPFEMCEIKFHVRVPMDCWRQWIRHRTANVNEYSTRYSLAIDSVHKTNPKEWRTQSVGNRQGSAGLLSEDVGTHLSNVEANLHSVSKKTYDERILKGVAREQARKDLPLSTYTEAYWKIDLWNLFHFLSLRMSGQAQLEIRSYAELIAHSIVAQWVPKAWQAFLDYELNAIKLTSLEAQILRLLLSKQDTEALALARSFNWIGPNDKTADKKRSRERTEFEDKLANHFGIMPPWMSKSR